MNCGGSSRLVEPRITSLLSFVDSLWHTFNSDLVAPPTMNTNIRCPIFLKSLDACLNTESLKEGKKEVKKFIFQCSEMM